jgi:hypothetical protein
MVWEVCKFRENKVKIQDFLDKYGIFKILSINMSEEEMKQHFVDDTSSPYAQIITIIDNNNRQISIPIFYHKDLGDPSLYICIQIWRVDCIFVSRIKNFVETGYYYEAKIVYDVFTQYFSNEQIAEILNLDV